VNLGALRPRTRTADMVLAVLVLAIVGMMIVPLPTPVIDGLIAINLTLGVLLLATALYMRDALSFAAFPTLILIATLYRLALNVSSTRLILLQADAGQIIEAFGSFVVRGDYAVGALVFLVITLIQFLVIARGAERVAEVGARFSLDAMPGKHMAIDAELRTGTLGSDAARSARKRLERESQLYGAMDGAMKFVKGDAIAGIVITMINFVGGVTLGATARGLDVMTSLKTYGLLTIGDGLVTQIPSLLGSTAAALAVTRVASDRSDGSLGSDIAEQLFGDARVLFVGALVLSVLAIVPGIPGWPFAAMAVSCALLGVRAQARPQHKPTAKAQTSARAKLELRLSPALASELLARGTASPALEQPSFVPKSACANAGVLPYLTFPSRKMRC
jgi:type III secretion protein V